MKGINKLFKAYLVVGGLSLAVATVFSFWYGNHRATRPPHSVTLTWHSSEGAASYNVYRSTASGVQGVKISTTAIPTYVDRLVPSGATFYYTVTAVSNGRESVASNEVKAVIP